MKHTSPPGGRITLLAGLLAVLLLSGLATAQTTISGVAYVSNTDSSTVSVIDLETMTDVVPPIHTGGEPRGSAVSPNGDRVYVVSRSADEVYAIDTSTHTIAATIPVSGADAYNCAITPDGRLLYVVCKWSNTVVVINTQTNTEVASIDLESEGVPDPSPEGLAITPDGSKVYIVNRQDESVLVISTATNQIIAGPIPVGSAPRDAAVTADGSKVIVVGEGGPVIIRTSDDTDTNAGLQYIGDQRDVVISGSRAYVTNFYNGNFQGPTIDIYNLDSETYVNSVPLTSGFKAYGIAISPDGTRAWVTLQNSDLLVAVDLVSGTELGTAATGFDPRGVSVVIEKATFEAFVLPKKVKLTLGGPGRDKIVASGFYDDGGLAVDYRQPVELHVGGFMERFRLTPVGKGRAYRYRGQRVFMQVKPNHRGSSRGKFRLKFGKLTLGGKVDPDAPLVIRFQAAGLPEAAGTVTLRNGFFGLGRIRGALLSPGFFPRRMKISTGDQRPDRVLLKGGFATNGVVPDSLREVRLDLGPVFSKVIPGDEFVKKGDTFRYVGGDTDAKLKLALNFARETIVLKSRGNEVGDLTGATAEIAVDVGSGNPIVRTVIRLGRAGSKRFY